MFNNLNSRKFLRLLRPKYLVKIKMIKKQIVRALLRLAPRKISLLIARIGPRFSRNLPLNIKGVFIYAEVFSVELDSFYPIEREMMSGTYEPEITSVISRLLCRGDCVIDVGANVGAISMLASRLVGEFGRVLSIEPGSLTNDRFSLSIRNNKIENIDLRRLGISDESSVMMWNMDLANPGNASLTENGQGESVNVVTLDSLVQELNFDSIKLIKIDVEGMELKCLRGALKTIDVFKPIVIFETLEAFGKNVGDDHIGSLEGFFLDRGYKLFEVDSCGIREVLVRSKASNTLAIHQSDTVSLKKCC